jgi:hypothetical protein
MDRTWAKMNDSERNNEREVETMRAFLRSPQAELAGLG